MLLIKEIALVITREEATLNARLFARLLIRLRLLEVVVAIVFARDFAKITEFERVALIVFERVLPAARVAAEAPEKLIVLPIALARLIRLVEVTLKVLPKPLIRATVGPSVMVLVTATAFPRESEELAEMPFITSIALPRVTLELRVAEMTFPTEYSLARVTVEAWLTEITTD